MSELRRVGDIDVSQDLDFQRREWSFQRIGWLVLLAITLLALAGGMGRGALSKATIRSSNDELVLRYDRLARHQAPSKLEITLQATAGQTIALWFDQEYVGGLEIRTILPQPESVVSGNGRITYHFNTQTDPRITFVIAPDKFWRRRAALGLENGPTVRFHQFIFP